MESETLKQIFRDNLTNYFIYVYKPGDDVQSEGDTPIHMLIPKGGAKSETKAYCILNRKEKTIKMRLEVFKKYAPYLLDFEVNLSSVCNTIRYLYIDTKGRYVVDGNKFKMYPIVVYDNHEDVLKENDWGVFLGLPQKNNTVSKVKCHFNEADGILKMQIKTFKKYAYYLRDFKIDLTGVNSSTKEVKLNNKHQIEISGKTPSMVSDKKEDNILANANVKFVCEENKKVLHDKACECLNNKMHLIDCTNEDIKDFHLCPQCKHKILIRSHTEDNQKFLWYTKFFRNITSQKGWNEVFALDKDIQLLDVGENFVVLKVKEDTWEIKFSLGTYHLFHNNYTMNEKGEREFLDGFHNQGHESSDLMKVLNYIHHYSWNVNHMTSAALINNEENKEPISIFKRALDFLEKVFSGTFLKKSA